MNIKLKSLSFPLNKLVLGMDKLLGTKTDDKLDIEITTEWKTPLNKKICPYPKGNLWMKIGMPLQITIKYSIFPNMWRSSINPKKNSNNLMKTDR
jgi:hypothetical protein